MSASTDNRAARRRLGVAIVILVLLLLLFACALLWPVSRDENGRAQSDAEQPPRGAIEIVSAEARVLDEVLLQGDRGVPVGVRAVLENTGSDRVFDRNWMRVDVEGRLLVPLDPMHPGVHLHTVAPDRLETGDHERVLVVFAVPAEMTEVTLTVLPGDARLDTAASYRLSINGDGSQ